MELINKVHIHYRISLVQGPSNFVPSITDYDNEQETIEQNLDLQENKKTVAVE